MQERKVLRRVDVRRHQLVKDTRTTPDRIMACVRSFSFSLDLAKISEAFGVCASRKRQ
jgi:hypothetical protein